MSFQNPDETFETQIQDWEEKIKSIQTSVTKRTNLSIFVGIPTAIVLAVLITLGASKLLSRVDPGLADAAGFLSLCMYPLAIIIPVILNNLWVQRTKQQAIQPLVDEILQASETHGISRTKIVDTLAADLSHSSVCEAVLIKVDPEKAAILKQERSKIDKKAAQVQSSSINPIFEQPGRTEAQPAPPVPNRTDLPTIENSMQSKTKTEDPTPNDLPERLCSKCQRKVKPIAGDVYRIYYGNDTGVPEVSRMRLGNTIRTTTTRHYRIAGSESVFICHECFYSQRIKEYKTNEKVFFITGFLGLCILIGILNLALGIREHNKIVKIQDAIQRNDGETLRQIIRKETQRYHLLPKTIVAEKMKQSGQPFTAFFTAEQYASLRFENG